MNSITRPRALASVLATAALVVGTLTALAAPAYAADPVAGGQQASPPDSIYPNQGNSGYDVSHYDMSMTMNVAISSTANANATTTISDGVATISAATTGAPLSSFSLDFQGTTTTLAAATLNVSSVTVNGEPATFSRIETTSNSSALIDNHKLVITPATPVDGAFTTVVRYAGVPVRHTDPDGAVEGWNATVDGGTFVNQPVGAMTLFPINNTPRDKATWTFTFNAPSKLGTSATASTASPGIRDAAVASNGDLISKTVSGDGSRTTWVWDQTKPMAAELAMVSIGRYDVYESDITLASGRTIKDWTFLDPAMSVANTTSFLGHRAQTKALIDFFETKYGPYPGNSSGSVVDITTGINYALETQDRSFFPGSTSRGTFYHEVMHQWFGNNVSPVDWNDLWLGEGPATVSETQVPYEAVWAATAPNSSETTSFNSYNSNNASAALWATPTAAIPSANELYNSPTYTRGAMALNALRTSIGHEDFELLMKQWQLTYGGQSKRTADFIALAESISGKNLTAFFNTWIYTSGKPAAWPSKFTYGIAPLTTSVNPEESFSLTLTDRNIGRVSQAGSVVQVDITDILDDAVIGTLPANVTQAGNVLTWAIPSTALNTPTSVAVPFTLNSGTSGRTLSATASTSATMLGGTCVNCVFSAVVGEGEIALAPTPTITGTVAVGSTLTAEPGTWTDGTALSYQWFVGETPIKGATASTYVTDNYAGTTTVKVQVTGTLAGSLPTVRTSAPTSAITRPTQTGDDPTISGTPQVGKTLTVNPGSGWLPGTFFAYQWQANGVNISGATGPEYVPALLSQVGQTITVVVTGSKAGTTNSARTSSTATAPVAGGVFESTPTPTITGTGRALSALTAAVGTWDRLTTWTYQWSSNGSPISGATNATYTPPVGMIGTDITVAVTGARPGYTSVTRTSAATTIQPAAQTLQPTPTISGTPTVWQTLTLAPGTWDSGTAQTYQWLADGTPIGGATNLGYTLQPADAGKVITASVTSTRTNYSDVTRTSLPTAAVALATLSSTPTPTIGGTAQVGETLTASAGSWDAGVDLAYQWFADGDPIVTATGETFRPGASQLGAVITVSVTGTQAGYTTVTKTSDATDEVVVGVFDPTSTPEISGTAKVGVELTADPGSWDGDATLTYQWFADGDEIVGATTSTYTPGAARLGAELTVSVTGSADGFTTVTKTSDPTAAVVKGTIASTDPTIAGTPQVDVVLTAVPGDWDDEAELSYQWSADGDEIEGADESEFIPGAAQLGAELTVTVTATREGYDTQVETSDASDPVAPGVFSSTPTPDITGSASKVGVELTAVPGTWTPGASLSYQWLADGDPIAGATASTFTPTADHVDAEISVAVTGTRAGYTSVTKTSASTSEVELGDQVEQPTPTISGNARFGQTLSAATGMWDSGTVQAIQWSADGTPIAGANGLTLTLGAAQIGTQITVSVTSTKAGYSPVTTTSAATAAVVAADLASTPVPKVVGTPKVGSLLSAVTSSWDAGTSLSYQWLANGTPVVGGTATTFVPGADEVGKTITIAITGSKTGHTTVTRTSAATKAVAVGTLVSTPAPKISGTARVGSTFTVVPGAWDAGTTWTYQWKRNGKSISGATGETYTMVAGDKGRTITVTAVGSKPGYKSVSKTSAGKKILAGIQVLKPKPAITGTLAVGSTLSVVPETHDAGTTVTYAWYADGKKVGSGATLTLTSKMKGKKIWVVSTSKKAGFTTVVMTSVKTPKVGVIA